MKKIMSLAAIVVATSGLLVGGAAASQATTKNGVPETGEFVQWYYTGYSGGCEDDYSADTSFFDDYFKSCGFGTSGVGKVVANNAESEYNYDYSYTAFPCTGVNYTGNCAGQPPRTGGNYNSTYKNNAESLYWRL